MDNLTKTQIAIGLFIGVIALTLFTFLRTIAEKFISEKIKKLSHKSHCIFGLIFLLGFIVIIILTGWILMIILVNQTDLHPLFDIFRRK